VADNGLSAFVRVVPWYLLVRILYGTLYRTVKSAHGGENMKDISANELKMRGVSSIEAVLQDEGEAMITVRGRERYVVMDLEVYNRLRVCELEAALYETRQEIERGEYIEETVDDHIAKVVKDR